VDEKTATEIRKTGLKQLTRTAGPDLTVRIPPVGITHSIRKKMRKDPQIALALAAIKAPIVAMDWSVESESAEVRAFVKAVLAPLRRKLVRASLEAVDFGFQAFEKIYEIRDVSVSDEDAASEGRPQVFTFPRSVVLADLKDIDPEQVRIEASSADGSYAGFTQTLDGEKVFVPARKSFIFTVGRRWGNLYGTSRIDAAYEVWHWCNIMYNFSNRYFERKGDPVIKGRAPAEARLDADGREVNTIEEAGRVIGNLRAGGTAVFPDERDEFGNLRWDFEYMLDDKRGDQFLDYITHLQTLKLRGVLVPERVLTQDNATGSYAMARAHTDTFLLSEEILANDLIDHINRYIVGDLVALNFGPDAPRASVTHLGLGASELKDDNDQRSNHD